MQAGGAAKVVRAGRDQISSIFLERAVKKISRKKRKWFIFAFVHAGFPVTRNPKFLLMVVADGVTGLLQRVWLNPQHSEGLLTC